MSSKDYIQSQNEELATHGSHYNLMKGRLQEKKKILILVICLHPLVLMSPKTLKKKKISF